MAMGRPRRNDENSVHPKSNRDCLIDQMKNLIIEEGVQAKAAPCLTIQFTNTINKLMDITIPVALRPQIHSDHVFHHIQLNLQIQKGMRLPHLLQATNISLAMERNENINVQNVDNILLDYII